MDRNPNPPLFPLRASKPNLAFTLLLKEHKLQVLGIDLKYISVMKITDSSGFFCYIKFNICL